MTRWVAPGVTEEQWRAMCSDTTIIEADRWEEEEKVRALAQGGACGEEGTGITGTEAGPRSLPLIPSPAFEIDAATEIELAALSDFLQGG